MINIISRSIISKETSGPKKVVENLIKGLEIINYPYCVNMDLKSTSQLWIHDDVNALKEASKLKIKAIVGPNIFILPRNIPSNLNLSTFTYVHPSQWAVDFWRDFGFNKCKLDYWPTGIDTNEFTERKKPVNGRVLVYFKQRYSEELDFVINELKNKDIPYEVIIYGSYKQNEYLEKLSQSKYVIWIGRQESQGIALEEALSTDVPILVWDVSCVGHWTPSKKEEQIFTSKELAYENTTCAYYFDERCGVKSRDKNQIPQLINFMEEKWNVLRPREFILENLNLKKQAVDFIELFNKYYNISYEVGKNESVVINKKWINGKLSFRTFIKVKESIKKCVKLLKK